MWKSSFPCSPPGTAETAGEAEAAGETGKYDLEGAIQVKSRVAGMGAPEPLECGGAPPLFEPRFQSARTLAHSRNASAESTCDA
jgi:hypothetical protein